MPLCRQVGRSSRSLTLDRPSCSDLRVSAVEGAYRQGQSLAVTVVVVGRFQEREIPGVEQ